MSTKSLYLERPWLKSYPQGIPPEVDVPVKSLCQAFDEATDKWGNKTAIIFYGKKISYREMRDKVDRFANALSDIGIKKGDRVIYAKYAGTEWKDKGQEYLILREADILAKTSK